MSKKARFEKAVRFLSEIIENDEVEGEKIIDTILYRPKLTKQEQLACRALSHMQISSDDEYRDSFYNKCLMFYCAKILRVNPFELFNKVFWRFKKNEP